MNAQNVSSKARTLTSARQAPQTHSASYIVGQGAARLLFTLLVIGFIVCGALAAGYSAVKAFSGSPKACAAAQVLDVTTAVCK